MKKSDSRDSIATRKTTLSKRIILTVLANLKTSIHGAVYGAMFCEPMKNDESISSGNLKTGIAK